MGGNGAGWPELVHRIGRAGRFGSKAIAINFVNEDDLKNKCIGDFDEKSTEELTNLIKVQLNIKEDIKTSAVEEDNSRVQRRLQKEQNLIRRNDELQTEFQ